MASNPPVQNVGSGRLALSLLVPECGASVIEYLAMSEGASTSEIADAVPAGRTSVYNYVDHLEKLGVITKRTRPRSGPTKNVLLTPYGKDLEGLVFLLRRWLESRPNTCGGPLQIEDKRATEVIRSRAEGWGNQVLLASEIKFRTRGEIVAALGEAPNSEAIDLDTGDKIAARIDRMVASGQLEPSSVGAVVRYQASDWGRRGLSCVAHAIWLELLHQPPGCHPPGRRTLELLLRQLPHLLALDRDVNARVAIEIQREKPDRPQSAVYRFIDGRYDVLTFGTVEPSEALIVGTLDELLGWIAGATANKPEIRGYQEAGLSVLTAAKRALSGL